MSKIRNYEAHQEIHKQMWEQEQEEEVRKKKKIQQNK